MRFPSLRSSKSKRVGGQAFTTTLDYILPSCVKPEKNQSSALLGLYWWGDAAYSASSFRNNPTGRRRFARFRPPGGPRPACRRLRQRPSGSDLAITPALEHGQHLAHGHERAAVLPFVAVECVHEVPFFGINVGPVFAVELTIGKMLGLGPRSARQGRENVRHRPFPLLVRDLVHKQPRRRSAPNSLPQGGAVVEVM